jgi:hypothetical protein
MPCTTDGTLTESGLVEVSSPNGTTYTAQPAHLVSTDDGAQMLRQRRGEKLVKAGYQIQRLRGDAYRVWQPKRHGDTGGYRLTLGALPSCTCPDAAKGNECKHIHGAPELLRLAQVTKPTVRVSAIVVSAEAAKAERIAAARARTAAMIAYDGWK